MAQLAIDDSAKQYEYPTGAPVFVLLHGLFGSGENLGGIRRVLEPHVRVFSVDLPGHGDSAQLDDYRHSRVAESLLGELGGLAVDKLHLVGHSWGGKVALQFASLWPERVASVVILDIAPVAYAPGHDDVFAAVAALDISRVTSRKSAAEQMENFLPNPDVRAFILKNLRRSPRSTAAGANKAGDAAGPAYRWRIDFAQLQQHYSEIAAAPVFASAFVGPALVLKGEASNYIQAGHQAAFAKFVPNAEFKVLQSAGHWLHAEKAAAVERLILNFYNMG